MRKEYSDLPDKQKITYYKRGVVYCIFVILPVAILFGGLFGVMSYYAPLIDEQAVANSTMTKTNESPKLNPFFEASFAILLFMSMVGFVGITSAGIRLGDYMCDKLKLWTDFQLEEIERKAVEIKKELSEN